MDPRPLRALRRLGPWLVAALVARSHPALGADDPAVTIAFVGPAGCATDASVSAEIRARTARARPPRPGEAPALRVVVRVAGRAPSRGTLTLEDARGTSARQLSARTCEDVVSGLVLVAALAIDPAASTDPRPGAALPERPPAPAPAPPAPPPMPPVLPAVRSPPATDPPTSAVSAVTAAPLLGRAREAEPEGRQAGVPRGRWRFAVGVEATVGDVGAPGVLGSGALFGDLALDRATVLAPSFRVAIRRSLEVRTTVGATALLPSAGATLAWTFARAEACPVRFGPRAGFAIIPCAFLDVGGLEAVGFGPKDAHADLEPWVAPGALARLAWEGALSEGYALVVGVGGGVSFPVVRHTFDFTGGPAVYTPPSAAPEATLGGGVRFP